jgi:hypothetical protein
MASFWRKRRIAAALAGVVLAAAAQFIALLLSGAGHAWVEPFFFSALLWPALPLMAIRLQGRAAGSNPMVDGTALLFGLILDALLVMATVDGMGGAFPMFGTGTERFLKVAAAALPLVLLWIALWLSWQGAALLLCLRGGRR